ncbi:MAG: glutathione S-transferase family protein [Proteobacteria bacterium]|nr:glutathione S-transferase family protein [Pseudomonadota bacterium]
MRLYHNPMSSCSQKVRMALAEKGLAFEDTVLDLQKGDQFDPAYMALNPNAVVPTLEDHGNVLIESTLINEYLDDAYPEVALKPAEPAARHRMRLLCKQIDNALHPACAVITYAIGVRPSLLARPKDEVTALVNKIPDPARREARRQVVDLGVAAPAFREAMLTHRNLFDTAEEMLKGSVWLAAESFSLADCALLPYALRIDHLGQGDEISSRPGLARWYQQIQARPAYAEAVTRWLSDQMVGGLRKAGDAVRADVAAVLN